MRTNFYICWGNRDKYFDWRLKTGKFNTKQQNTDTKVRPQRDVGYNILCKLQNPDKMFSVLFSLFTRTRYILLILIWYHWYFDRKINLELEKNSISNVCLFPWNRYRSKLITISDLWGRTLQFLIENLIWPARPSLLVTRLWQLWGDPCISRYSEMWISFNLFWAERKAWA